MKISITGLVWLVFCMNRGYAEDFKKKNFKKAIDLNKIYLKIGIGNMKYKKFKLSGPYENKALKTNKIYSVGLGYKLTNSVRADINFQRIKSKYRDRDEDTLADFDTIIDNKQTIKTTAIFLNGYYDLSFNKHIKFYTTAGCGIGRNNTGTLTQLAIISGDPVPDYFRGKTTTHFIWNIGTGIRYILNKHFALDLEYRYMDLGKAKVNGALSSDGVAQLMRGTQAMVFLSYSF